MSLEAKRMHEELNKLLFVVVCTWSRFEKKVFACLYANRSFPKSHKR